MMLNVILFPIQFLLIIAISLVYFIKCSCFEKQEIYLANNYKLQQMVKILCYVFSFLVLVNTTFCWINVYNGHMFITSIGRSFLAIDQCSAQTNNENSFNDVFEFFVWLNYWII